MKTPRILCLPNGPYYLVFGEEPEPVPFLRRADGSSCSTVRAVALCRCGQSRNKPLCDGTHGTVGFSDARLEPRSPDRRTTYAGPKIAIHDNRGLCAHIGHCTEGLSAVFREEGEPWIDAAGATAEAIAATVRRCPSGALGYSVDGVEATDRDAPPAVTALRDGPYAVTGGIELVDVAFGEGASREHYTLCRCGASRNKPFCDGSHWEVGFRDPVESP